MNLTNILQETDLTKIYLEQFKLSTTPSLCIIFNFKSSKFGMIINANNKLKQALSLWGGRKAKRKNHLSSPTVGYFPIVHSIKLKNFLVFVILRLTIFVNTKIYVQIAQNL